MFSKLMAVIGCSFERAERRRLEEYLAAASDIDELERRMHLVDAEGLANRGFANERLSLDCACRVTHQYDAGWSRCVDARHRPDIRELERVKLLTHRRGPF